MLLRELPAGVKFVFQSDVNGVAQGKSLSDCRAVTVYAVIKPFMADTGMEICWLNDKYEHLRFNWDASILDSTVAPLVL